MLPVVILLLGAVGHVILWVALVNRAHALGIRRRWVSLLTLACIVLFAVIPVAVLAAYISARAPEPTLFKTVFFAAAWTYIIACAVVGIAATVQRMVWRFHAERRGALVSNHTTRANLADRTTEPLTSPGFATWLSRIPGNQILDVHVHEKQVMMFSRKMSLGRRPPKSWCVHLWWCLKT